LPEALRIELSDFKRPITALVTSWPASQPGATLLGGLLQGSVYDLDQLAVRGHSDTDTTSLFGLTKGPVNTY
jgi:hypothetical protein